MDGIGNWTLRQVLGLSTALAAATMLTAATTLGPPQQAAILVLNRGDPVSQEFYKGFAAAFRARHPALAAEVPVQALSLPGDEAGYVRDLQRAARRRPLLFVARNGYQADLAHRFAPETALLFQTYVDPRETGVVSSLQHHPENATGLWIADTLDTKRLETLLDAYTGLARVGLVVDTGWLSSSQSQLAAMRDLARLRGVRLQLLQATSTEEAMDALQRPEMQSVQAWCLPRTPLSVDGRLVARIAAQGKPVMVAHTPDLQAGAHLSYAHDKSFTLPALADLAARIVQGEPAGSIPIQTPHRYQLAVRLAADERLPALNPAVVRRADLVIRP